MLGTKYKTTVSEEFPVISSPAIQSSISTMDSMLQRKLAFRKMDLRLYQNVTMFFSLDSQRQNQYLMYFRETFKQWEIYEHMFS